MPVEGVEGFVAIIKSVPAHRQVALEAIDHRTGQGGYVQVTMD